MGRRRFAERAQLTHCLATFCHRTAYVSEMLGHANISITLGTYSHVIPRLGDAAAEAMEDALKD